MKTLDILWKTVLAGLMVLAPIFLTGLLVAQGFQTIASVIRPAKHLLPHWLPNEEALAVQQSATHLLKWQRFGVLVVCVHTLYFSKPSRWSQSNAFKMQVAQVIAFIRPLRAICSSSSTVTTISSSCSLSRL